MSQSPERGGEDPGVFFGLKTWRVSHGLNPLNGVGRIPGDCSVWGEFFDVVRDTIRDIAYDATEAVYAACSAAYAAATGRWSGADWTHESSVEDDGTPVICGSATCASCSVCAAAAEDAAAAEASALEALAAAREGDWATACAAARAAYELERTWGDAPTWGPFARAVAAARAALDDAPDVPDDEDDDLDAEHACACHQGEDSGSNE